MATESRYAALKCKGLCVVCGKTKSESGKVRCAAHHARSLDWQRKKRQKPREIGICACGKAARPKGTTCSKCYDYHRKYGQRYFATAKAEGRCTRCNGELHQGGVYCENCRLYCNDQYRKLREQVFAAYGGFVCRCCGDTTPEFLQIDHIENNGAEHRRKLGGAGVYKWLRRNGYPPGFQVLCANCNIAKSRYGVCPHQTKR